MKIFKFIFVLFTLANALPKRNEHLVKSRHIELRSKLEILLRRINKINKCRRFFWKTKSFC